MLEVTRRRSGLDECRETLAASTDGLRLQIELGGDLVDHLEQVDGIEGGEALQVRHEATALVVRADEEPRGVAGSRGRA